MRNEHGFFNIIGLCLLLALALLITGVQEFEANYTRGAINYRMETELKNAAESALIEATKNPNLTSMKIGDITVQIERKEDNVYFKTDGNFSKDTYAEKIIDLTNKQGKIFMAVASCENNFMEGRAYWRALAFVTDGTIHFVNDL